ncbi:MAG TPA: MBL fold metallo-hydrolase [Crenalkalicoccus sp.]|nr:MBL fold metallo-hydrolase [Crenalkalicoccus sp.]
MRIHHLDCGPMRPLGGALMDGVSRGLYGHLTCHCLAIETKGEGVVLVDTGLGLRDMLRPWPRLPWWNAGLLGIRFDPERTMLRQLKARGIRPGDVRHIVMTHLDFDHAGGLVDFPEARVHLMEPEAVAARRRDGLLGRTRYRPVQWGDTTRWHPYSPRAGGRWFGFDAVTQLDNLPPEILLVPLPGHTAGQAGVAVQGPRGWLLHAADAYFNRAEVHAGDTPHAPPGAGAYETIMAWDTRLVRANQARLRALLRDPEAEIAVFCTHDPVEYVAMSLWEERGVPALSREAANDPGVAAA